MIDILVPCSVSLLEAHVFTDFEFRIFHRNLVASRRHLIVLSFEGLRLCIHESGFRVSEASAVNNSRSVEFLSGNSVLC